MVRHLLLAALAAAATATAQSRFDVLRKEHLPEGSSTAIALGDLDGDGDQDLVTVPLRVHRNVGGRCFVDDSSAALPTLAAAIPSAIVLADVDGDGDLDLVVGNANTRPNLLTNDGSGIFDDATSSTLPARALPCQHLVAGDVDGDGDQDLVFANSQALDRLYLNAGNGVFTDVSEAHLPIRSIEPEKVALVDVDGDQDLDLVFATRLDGGALFENDGNGVFSDVTDTQWPAMVGSSFDLAALDVDGDSDVDLALGGSGRVALLLNDGNGLFGMANGNLPPLLTSVFALGAADVDGDGDRDLMVGSSWSMPPYAGRNRLWLNDGSGVFSNAPAGALPPDEDFVLALATGDVDADGDPDLITGNTPHDRLYFNDGSGRFADAMREPLPGVHAAPNCVAFGDLDGDGDLDAIVGNDDWNRLLRNDGAFGFSHTTTELPYQIRRTQEVALADVDGDGDLDLLGANDDRGANPDRDTLLLNDGNGAFTDVSATNLQSWTGLCVSVGDIDGDGDVDAAIRTTLHRNDGSGVFQPEPTLTPEPLTRDNALVDVDGDGDLDLVSCGQGRDNLLLNDGAGAFTDVTAIAMPASTSDTLHLDTGDLDGDGDVDLLLARGGTAVLLRNDGTGVFSEELTPLPTAAPILAVALLDFDGDGDLDAAAGNDQTGGWSGQNELFVNDGSGTFAAAPGELPVDPSRTGFLIGCDLDDDGDQDLVVCNALAVRAYSNRTRHAHTTRLPVLGDTYRIDWHAIPAPQIAVPMLAAGTARIPLSPYGLFQLDPAGTVALPPVPIAAGVGTATTSIPIPPIPALVGGALFFQAFLVDGQGAVRLTNMGGDLVVG